MTIMTSTGIRTKRFERFSNNIVERDFWKTAFALTFSTALMVVGCAPKTYMTMLRHPDTGDVKVCRPAVESEATGGGTGQTPHDQCVQQLTSLGYKISGRSGD